MGSKSPAPSATQRLAERDQAVKARQLVLRELVPGGIERSLQLEQRQEVPRAPLVPHPGTFERTFALVDVDPLELFNGLQVLESRKCLLDIDQPRGPPPATLPAAPVRGPASHRAARPACRDRTSPE